ncbi:MAG TPA: hypothetical protein PJ991_11600 [Kiritimatiellia bacterium]|nr:hypothetical protein [Kiritimatiellia bacterium]
MRISKIEKCCVRNSVYCLLTFFLTPAILTAHAATFTVTNTNDSGGGSLRQAIINALASPPPNEIHFNIPGPGPHTIKVGATLPTITNATSILGNTQPGYAGTPLVTILGPTSSGLDYGIYLLAPGTLVRGLRVTGFTQLDFGAGITMYGGQIAACVLDGNFNGVIAQGGTVGGTSTNDRNIIINNENGIWTVTGSTATVRGNFIGVQADGVTPAGNENGIRTFYTKGLVIEGHPDYPQVISGNQNAGVLLGPNGGYSHFSSDNTIRGNRIGTDITGMIAVPNNIGIHVWGGGGNIIGGTTINHRNIISGNHGAGVLIEGILLGLNIFAYNNQVRGNYIGLAADGVTPLANDLGVDILNSRNNTVGGDVAAEGNRFGRANFYNIRIHATHLFSHGNSVMANIIGITTNNVVIPSAGYSGVEINSSSNNIVGGTTIGQRNYIAGVNAGVSIRDSKSMNNQVKGNNIGVGVNDSTPHGINSYGVHIFNAPKNQIGGVFTNEGNVISAAQWYGVWIERTGSYANVVQGNRIGTDRATTIAVSNRYSGVDISGGAFSNVVGGADANTANVIAGNGGSAVSIRDTNTYGNVVQNNFIGMNRNYLAITNGSYGVEVVQASANLIGSGNYIGNSRSPAAGVRIGGANAIDNVVYGNVVGMDNVGNPHPNYNGIEVVDARNTIVGFSLFAANLVGGNQSDGINVRGSASNTQVRVNFVGVDPSGSSAVPNGGRGIYVDAPYSTVGGIGFGNIVSGNNSSGIWIGSGGTNAIVQGNYVGTDASGSMAIKNNGTGVRVDAPEVLVGGVDVQARNLISGNNGGIEILPTATNAVIQGNYIGVNGSGTAAITNNGTGVRIWAPGALLGGTNVQARNLISGNNGGVDIQSTATNAVIQGNYIGVNGSGTAAITNNGMGVTIRAPGVLLGGSTTNARNIISGNEVNGVEVITGAHGTVVQGNNIGVDVTGMLAISNRQYGIIVNNSDNVIIGGLGAARNVISASRLTGLVVSGTSSNTFIAGNYIGTSANGLLRIGNGTAGIGVDADYTTIGVAFAGLGNVISGNGAGGIEVNTGRNVRIVNNFIGLGANGVTNLPNFRGIWLKAGAQNVMVGGTNPLSRNVIARNTGPEIVVEGPSGGHLIQGNFIGVQDFGVTFPTGNAGYGIELINSPSNHIIGNVIGQVVDAIGIINTGSHHNVVLGNFIGEYNLEPMPSAGWGVLIQNASHNRIGGLTQSERNVIAHNVGGISVTNSPGTNAINNLLAVNLVFSNKPRLNIDLGPAGFNANDPLDADEGANRLQNRPDITNQITVGTGFVYVQGALSSAPLATYAVDIYRSGSTNIESRSYLGRTYVNTDAGGIGPFTAGFAVNLAPGVYLTATATDLDNNTSELARSPTGLIFKASTDGDNDGIPDWWEVLYGLNPSVSNAPTSDVDNDGFSDLEEYIADTHPNDPFSYPVITEIASEANRLVTFPTSAARLYSLHYNDDLGMDAWTQMGAPIPGTYGSITMVDTNLPDWRNYRMSVQLP